MSFVLDASIVHAWAFDERHPIADAVLKRMHSDPAVAPGIWWFEVRNGLVMAERRGRTTQIQTEAFLRRLARLGVTVDDIPDEERVIALARRHRLTFYDAAYLELALRNGIALATLDRNIVKAAGAEIVEIVSA